MKTVWLPSANIGIHLFEIMMTITKDGRYFDIYCDGKHVNEGEPWFDTGEGAPQRDELVLLIKSMKEV